MHSAEDIWGSETTLFDGNGEYMTLKGFRTGLPTMCYFGMWIIWSQRQSRPCGPKRNFHLSLKEFKLGALSVLRIITRKNVL